MEEWNVKEGRNGGVEGVEGGMEKQKDVGVEGWMASKRTEGRIVDEGWRI